MKILQIVNYYYPHIGGIEQVARDIVFSLKYDNNIEQKIICFNEDAKDDNYINNREETITENVDGVEIIRCGCFTKISSQSLSFSYYSRLKKILHYFNPDIIIFHYPNPFVASFLLKLINKNTKFIIYWHLDIVKQKILGKLFNKQNIDLLKRADKIVATSPNYIEGSKFLSKYKNKCTVIPNCVTNNYYDLTERIIEKSKEIRKKYEGKCICFTIGRHIPYKGFEYLIESSKYLDENYVILIGGKGPLTNKLKEMSKETSNVELLGFISNDDLKSYYLACDIITFSSITKNEAFGISLAEGMGFGKPAITYTIPGSGVNYVNLDGITGIECDNRNVKQYAESIEKLFTNKELMLKYGEAARERILNNFTFEIFKNNILQTINNL